MFGQDHPLWKPGKCKGRPVEKLHKQKSKLRTMIQCACLASATIPHGRPRQWTQVVCHLPPFPLPCLLHMQLTTSGTFLSVDFFQLLIFFILPKPKSSTVGEREGWSDFQLQSNSQLILSIPLFLAGIWKQVISHSNTRNLLHNCQATPSLLAAIPCYRLQLSLAIPGYPLQLFLAATPVQPMDWGSRNLMHSLSQATVSHGAFSRLAHLLFFSLFMFTTTQPCGRGCIKVEYFGAHVLLRASALWVSNVTFCFFCPVPVQWAAILYLLLCFCVFVLQIIRCT